MKFDKKDYPDLLPKLNDLAIKNGYGKIFAKVPATAQPFALLEGYIQEAYIPQFYNGDEGVFFMSRYLDAARSEISPESLSGLTKLLLDPHPANTSELPANFEIRKTELQDAPEMAKIYQQVFKTYPFPITEVSYLQSSMKDGTVIYFGIWDKGNLIGLSSAEPDRLNLNAEMTDFAVLPEYRGQKLASFLLIKMEEEMERMNFKTLYTIARLNSPGMTKTFINQKYHYSGLLKNNTNISGQIESMNVFYKNR